MIEFWFFLVNMAYVSVAVVAVFAMARVADKMLGMEFKENVLPEILSHPIGAGIYYGLRWFGFCWLVATALS